MDKINKRAIIRDYVKNLDINMNITCGDFCEIRDDFATLVKKKYGTLNGFFGLTEDLLVEWFKNYFLSEQISYQVFNESVYKAAVGQQKIDIPIINSKNEIVFGISVKARTNTSAYMSGADFLNPLIKDNDNYLRAQKSGRISLPTFLQDYARIENLQLHQSTRFKSITIIYDKINKKNKYWVDKFINEYGHNYIFLKDQRDQPFRESMSNFLF